MHQCGIRIHCRSPFVRGLPGDGNVGQTAERERLVPGELPAAMTVGLRVVPEKAKRLGSFRKAEVGASLVFRWQDFEPVVVLLFGDFRDATGN